MRKKMHKNEKDWLKGKASVQAKCLRKEYLKSEQCIQRQLKGQKGPILRRNESNWNKTGFHQRNSGGPLGK